MNFFDIQKITGFFRIILSFIVLASYSITYGRHINSASTTGSTQMHPQHSNFKSGHATPSFQNVLMTNKDDEKLNQLKSTEIDPLKVAVYGKSKVSNASTTAIRSTVLPLGTVYGGPCERYPEVTVFHGIPYANPVSGEHRFKAPTMFDQMYKSIGLDATKPGPPCGSLCGLDGFIGIVAREDCLYLNIWVPPAAVPEKSKLPVRVYIHGGAVTECSASDINIQGCDYAKKNSVIQVNIQFRIGVFGYLAHPETMKESNTTGNWGLLDQQLALKWVQKHISAFGGDPDKVMINGNSAGGQRATFHMVLPGSKGLFSSAIAQSPPCMHFLPLEKAYDVSGDFIAQAGCSNPGNASAEISCMRELRWEELQDLARTMGDARPQEILLCEAVEWKSFFHYVLDGTVVPTQAAEAFANGNFNQVPYMVGVNGEDGRTFIEMLFGTTNLTSESGAELLESIYPGINAHTLIDTLYPEERYRGNPFSVLLTMLWTDIFFSCPAYRLLRAMRTSASSPVYLYQFGVNPTCPLENQLYGPAHGAELEFTRGVTTNILTTTCNMTEPEVDVANTMTNAWSTMADLGVPTWLTGNKFDEWNVDDQIGALFEVSSAGSRSTEIDFASKCNTYDKAIQEIALVVEK